MTAPPNAPEVDVLSVLTVAACSVASLANIRRDAGLNLAADIYEQESKEIDLARTAVAAMLTREAALVAERGALAAEVGALRGLLSDTAANLDRMAGDEFSDCDLVRLNYAVARINDNLARTTAARAEAGHG